MAPTTVTTVTTMAPTTVTTVTTMAARKCIAAVKKDAGSSGPNKFEDADIDPKDGKVSVKEFMAFGMRMDPKKPQKEFEIMFGQLDRDRDQFLDMKEFDELNKGSGGGQGGPSFEFIDTDKNGKVSFQELEASIKAMNDTSQAQGEGLKTMFDIADRDKDQSLDKKEFAAIAGGEGGCDQDAVEECTSKIDPMLMMAGECSYFDKMGECYKKTNNCCTMGSMVMDSLKAMMTVFAKCTNTCGSSCNGTMCFVPEFDAQGMEQGAIPKCMPRGMPCPCNEKYQHRCHDQMRGAYCAPKDEKCPVFCNGNTSMKCYALSFDTNGFQMGEANESCVAKASDCKCGAGALPTACKSQQFEMMGMMTPAEANCEPIERKQCPVVCDTKTERKCVSNSYGEMGWPTSSNMSCAKTAADCKCMGTNVKTDACLTGTQYGMRAFESYQCMPKSVTQCPVECNSSQQECYGTNFDVNGTATGMKRTCVKQGMACPCDAKWEHKCTEPMFNHSYCQSKEYACPINCGAKATCYSNVYDVNGTNVKDKYGGYKMKETCAAGADPSTCGCVTAAEHTCNVYNQTMCLPKKDYASCPVVCSGATSATCYLPGFNAKGEYDSTKDKELCVAKDSDCAGKCGAGGRWCGKMDWEGWCQPSTLKCPLVCTSSQKECWTDEFDSIGNWKSTNMTCAASAQTCPCSANALACVDEQKYQYCIPKKSGSTVNSCPVVCNDKQKMCFVQNFLANGTADASKADVISCVAKIAKCACGTNAQACSMFDAYQNASFEWCQPSVQDGVANSCPVICKANQQTCQVQNFDKGGKMTGFKEMCIPKKGGSCACGTNSNKCQYTSPGGMKSSWCQPQWDEQANAKMECPFDASTCKANQKMCSVPAFDGKGAYVTSKDFCGSNSSACDCSKGSGAKSCTQGGITDCIGPNDFCPVTCKKGQVQCPPKENFNKKGKKVGETPPAKGQECKAKESECACGSASRRCTFPGSSWCQAATQGCPVECTSAQKLCTISNYNTAGDETSSVEKCIASNATCPCGAKNVRCVIGGSAMCFPATMKKDVCPCSSTQDVCYVKNFDTSGQLSGMSTKCVSKGGACPCGKNTRTCEDPQDAKAKICTAKFSQSAATCPQTCTSTQENKEGKATCVQKNVDAKGKPIGESVSCLVKGKCPAGRGQKKCPTGATISTKTACKDIYGVLNKNQTKARRLLQSSAGGSKQTATITFTLTSLKGTAKDAPTAKANLDSVLQLQSELQTSLSMVISGSQASMIYKVTNLGTSQVKPSQVTEKLRGFLNSGDSKVKIALATLGTVKLGAKGCCTMSTNVQTVVDKSPCGTTGVTCAAEQYQDPAKRNAIRGSDGGKAACCIAKATCSKHTCTGTGMMKNAKKECVGGSNTCQATCCIQDPATKKCGTTGVTCNAGTYQDSNKKIANRGSDMGKTSCCTAMATCATFTCPSDVVANSAQSQTKCSGGKSTCAKATCCKAKPAVCADSSCPPGLIANSAKSQTPCVGDKDTCLSKTCCKTKDAKATCADYTCSSDLMANSANSAIPVTNFADLGCYEGNWGGAADWKDKCLSNTCCEAKAASTAKATCSDSACPPGLIANSANSQAQCAGDKDTCLSKTCCKTKDAKATCADYTCSSDLMENSANSKMECSGGKDTCLSNTCCKAKAASTAKATCADFTCPSDLMANSANSQRECSGDKSTCEQAACCTAKSSVVKATCADYTCPADLMANAANSAKECAGKVVTCGKETCCQSKIVASETKATCASFTGCPSDTKAKDTTTKCTGSAATSCVQATCCIDVSATIVKGSVSFEVALPTGVTQAQFLEDATVKTGVSKGIAKKLGVNHEWVTVILSAARRLAAAASGGGAATKATKANVKVDFTVTVPAGTTGATSADTIQTSLKGTGANSDAEKTAWATNVVTEIKAASPTTYASFSAASVTTKSVAHVALAPTPSGNSTGLDGPMASGADVTSGMEMHLVMMAIGFANMAA